MDINVMDFSGLITNSAEPYFPASVDSGGPPAPSIDGAGFA
jgi:hypothetical protein